ncbi:MAG: hypothetical protein AB1500_12190 [Bacillota bacterium]
MEPHDYGFTTVGKWKLGNSKSGIDYSLNNLKNKRVIYAFSEGSTIKYLGVCGSYTLSKRMSGYKNPGPSQTTNIRIAANIKKCLENNQTIEILALHPKSPLNIKD